LYCTKYVSYERLNCFFSVDILVIFFKTPIGFIGPHHSFFLLQVPKEGKSAIPTGRLSQDAEQHAGTAATGRRVQTLQALKALMADFASKTPTGTCTDSRLLVKYLILVSKTN
jgi:hypothetical protein